jgi:hypothetical protein
MNSDTSKIQLNISDDRITISDRMPIKFLDISIFLVLTSVFAIFFLGVTGIVYSLIFSLGYVLFRYFAWLIWKRIEIDFDSKKLTITNMLLNKVKSSEILTSNFDYSNFTLKEFEQSGMKRAMIQYQSHKLMDLLLLTHQDDIELVKNEIFNKKSG